MSSPTTNESTAQASAAENRRDSGHERAQNANGTTQASSSPGELDDLARAQEDLAQQARQHVALQVVENGSDGGDEARVGRMLTDSRSQLQELVRPEYLIEATYCLADQGLRVGRRLALTVSDSARELVPLR